MEWMSSGWDGRTSRGALLIGPGSLFRILPEGPDGVLGPGNDMLAPILCLIWPVGWLVRCSISGAFPSQASPSAVTSIHSMHYLVYIVQLKLQPEF